MNRRSVTSTIILSLLAAAGAAAPAFAQQTGPSTTQSSYMVASDPGSGVIFRSIISNGNGTTTNNELYPRLDPNTNLPIAGQNYRMVGIPDGLGAFSNGDGTFTLLMNHELNNAAGIVRTNGTGTNGSFVSRWVIGSTATGSGANFLQVTGGRDADTTVNLFSGGSYTAYNAANPLPVNGGVSRLCSGDLPAPSAFAYTAPNGTVYGTDARIFMGGEESGPEGRAFAHIVTGPEAGNAYQLPYLGRFSWENAVANPLAQLNTVVVGTDDTANQGGLYVYVGTRQTTGNAIDRAGLSNGGLYSVSVSGTTNESQANVLGTSSPVTSAPFSLSPLNTTGNVSSITGAQLQASGVANGEMNWRRPEDAAWNPANPNQLFFVTTASVGNNSRLWRMSFSDITNPSAGGNVEMLFDGTSTSSLAGGLVSATGASTVEMMDNMCVTNDGRFVLIQEDAGPNNRLGRLWLYDIASDLVTEVGISDAARFSTGAPGFLTNDEETSGIIDASDILGQGWFLLNMQAHYAIGTSTQELVEGGQVMALYIPQTVPTPGAAGLLGLAGLAIARRRR